jgi:hypothetical protein
MPRSPNEHVADSTTWQQASRGREHGSTAHSRSRRSPTSLRRPHASGTPTTEAAQPRAQSPRAIAFSQPARRCAGTSPSSGGVVEAVARSAAATLTAAAAAAASEGVVSDACASLRAASEAALPLMRSAAALGFALADALRSDASTQPSAVAASAARVRARVAECEQSLFALAARDFDEDDRAEGDDGQWRLRELAPQLVHALRAAIERRARAARAGGTQGSGAQRGHSGRSSSGTPLARAAAEEAVHGRGSGAQSRRGGAVAASARDSWESSADGGGSDDDSDDAVGVRSVWQAAIAEAEAEGAAATRAHAAERSVVLRKLIEAEDALEAARADAAAEVRVTAALHRELAAARAEASLHRRHAEVALRLAAAEGPPSSSGALGSARASTRAQLLASLTAHAARAEAAEAEAAALRALLSSGPYIRTDEAHGKSAADGATRGAGARAAEAPAGHKSSTQTAGREAAPVLHAPEPRVVVAARGDDELAAADGGAAAAAELSDASAADSDARAAAEIGLAAAHEAADERAPDAFDLAGSRDESLAGDEDRSELESEVAPANVSRAPSPHDEHAGDAGCFASERTAAASVSGADPPQEPSPERATVVAADSQVSSDPSRRRAFSFGRRPKPQAAATEDGRNAAPSVASRFGRNLSRLVGRDTR